MRVENLRFWLGMALVAVLFAGFGAGSNLMAADTEKIDHLLGLIQERVEVAPEVARAKWNSKTPIDDLPREKRIIEGVAKLAPQFGLDPEVATTFFLGQIEASKRVQRKLHAEWTASAQPPFDKVSDLGNDIRPVLDRLTPALLRALALALPELVRPGGRQMLEERIRAILGPGRWSEASMQEAVEPLLRLSK